VKFSDAMESGGWGRDRDGDAARRAAQNVQELPDGTAVAGLPDGVTLRALPSGGHSPDMPEPDPVPGHELTREQNGSATVVRCACGRWDGAWLGPRSRRRVLDDHAAHVATELAAAGPLRVVAVRADTSPELEP